MSAHMQQAIRMLQLPMQELQTYIEEQVVQNPILEIDENQPIESPDSDDTETSNQEDVEIEVSISDDDLSILNRLEEDIREHFDQNETPMKRSTEEDKLKTYLEQSISAKQSLSQQLLSQAHDTFEDPLDLEISEILIGYIDEFGFLKTPITEICFLHQLAEEDVKRVLKETQSFEPQGIAAASIQESLLIQLRCQNKESSLAYQLIRDYYDELLHHHIPTIQKKLKLPFDAIQEAIEHDIAKLDLHPGSHFSSLPSQTIIPDATIQQDGEKLYVEIERDSTPSLRVNLNYLKMLNDSAVPKETKHFIKHHIFSARWLMRNLQQRYSTLERIAQSLCVRQHDFFTKPEGQLVPLTMKMIAEELDVHESTIARTVSNKYIYTPKGLFSLRSFFTTKYISEEGEDLSASTIKQAIAEMIEQEDKQHPLSDEKISSLLKEKGIPCARRTVAKYRTALKIGNAQQRRKYH
jgi:RNA polymerase sigma-54 factor